MNLTLMVWRQKSPKSQGKMAQYAVEGVSEHSSFLEMLDMLNDKLVGQGEEPIAFDHDCREGICGMCSMVINGVPHGPEGGTTACQLHMRSFQDGAVIYIEPWRAAPFPVIKDLVVDRTAFDRIQQKGGYVSVATGGSPDANALPISKAESDTAMDAATCIGCGACVAACKNSSAMLFVGAKVSQYVHLPQGQPERNERVLGMVHQMDKEGFGNCTNLEECEAACPKEISVRVITELNREFIRASLLHGGAE